MDETTQPTGTMSDPGKSHLNEGVSEVLEVVMVECLICGIRQTLEKAMFRGHGWCPGCSETTNQVEVREES